jgi:hypothetical protein
MALCWLSFLSKLWFFFFDFLFDLLLTCFGMGFFGTWIINAAQELHDKLKAWIPLVVILDAMGIVYSLHWK